MSAVPLLRRFDIFTYKNKNGTTDTAQIPTAATVSLYRQGATTTASFTVTSGNLGPYSVTVDDIGEIVAGDAVQIGTDASKGFTVDSIPDRTHLSLLNDLSLNTTVASGSRVVVASGLMTIYADALAAITTSNPITADSSTGRAQAYVRNKRFDYIVSGTVSPSRLFINAEGGFIPESQYVNALDFASIQAAVDALGAVGGVVFIPGGTYHASSIPTFTGTLTLPVGVPIHVLGEGRERTILRPTDVSQADLLHIQGSAQIVEGLNLDGYNRTSTSEFNGRGIVVGVAHGGIDGAQVRDCSIVNTAGWSLYIQDGAGASDGLALMCVYSRVRIYGNRALGAIYVGIDNTTQHFDNCYVQPFTGRAVEFAGAGGSFVDCGFEGPDAVSDSTTPAFIDVHGTSLRLQHCWFEDHYTGYTSSNHPNYFISTASVSDAQPAHNLQVIGCVFARDTSNEARLIHIGLGAKSVIIEGCDAIVHVQQPCPRQYSDAVHIAIDPPSGGASSEVAITGCSVRDYCQYIPLKVDDGNDLVGKTSGIGATVLLGAPLAGVYRLTAILVCTMGDPDFLTVTMGWNNESGAQTLAVLNNVALDSPGEWWGECVVHAVSGTGDVPITYSVSKAGTRAAYNLYVRAERVL